MIRFRTIASAALAGCLASLGCAAPADAQTGKAPEKPPELTDVSGRLMYDDDTGTTGGVAFFIRQSRLNELPHEDPIARVRAMSEVGVAIDAGGSFTLEMAPGNYALIFDPSATADAEALKPGADSSAVSKRMTPEKIKARIEAIKENAQKGLPVKNGQLDGAFVIENVHIRPPVTDFGEMVLGVDHSVTIRAVNDQGTPSDLPVILRLRGLNGDVYEPHPMSSGEPATYKFHDLFPQRYDAFVFAARAKPGSDDGATTPVLKNAAFMFEGKPLEQRVTVTPPEPEKRK
jgi:hypothetical protein